MSLQSKAINKLHTNHVGTGKIRMLACDSIDWININANIKEVMKSAPMSLLSGYMT